MQNKAVSLSSTKLRQRLDIILWVALNLVDFAATIALWGMGSSDVHTIINLFRYTRYGVAWFASYKVTFILAAIAVLLRINKPQLFRWLNLGMAAIVAWNIVWLVVGWYIIW